MSREKAPLGSMPKLFSRHSAQLFERASSIRERSSASLVGRFVSAPEAKQHFLSLVDPYPFVTTPSVSETYKPDGGPVEGGATHDPIRDSWPMAWLDGPKGHRMMPETRVF